MSAPEPQAGASARPWRTDRTDIFDAYGNKIASVSGSETQLDDAALIVQAVKLARRPRGRPDGLHGSDRLRPCRSGGGPAKPVLALVEGRSRGPCRRSGGSH